MNSNLTYKIPYILVALLLVVFVILRIVYVPITTDEVWTLNVFVHESVWHVMTASIPSANNHILNSLLTKASVTLFGDGILPLRIANLIGLLAYLYGAYRLSTTFFNNKLLSLLMFLSLCGNYTITEYFGLCRGYGLSIGLLLLAVSYLCSVAVISRRLNNKHVHLGLLFALLAAYANLTVLYAVLAIYIGMFMALWLRYQQDKKGIFNAIKTPFVYGLLLLLLVGYPLQRMYNNGELYYGGDINFINNTLYGIFTSINGNYAPLRNYDAYIGIIITLAIAFILILTKTKRRSLHLILPGSIFFFCTLLINIFFYTLGVKLPLDRTTLYLYPLLITSIFAAIALFSHLRITATIPAAALCCYLTFCFITNINLRGTVVWWDEAFTPAILTDVVNDIDGDNANKAKVYVTQPLAGVFNYYIRKQYEDVMLHAHSADNIANINLNEYDYIVLRNYEDISNYPTLEKINTYHESGALILYKNTAHQRH